jgi:hypothetical protein
MSRSANITDPFASPVMKTYELDVGQLLTRHDNKIKTFESNINWLTVLSTISMILVVANICATVGWNSVQQSDLHGKNNDINDLDKSVDHLDQEINDLNICTQELCNDTGIFNQIRENITNVNDTLENHVEDTSNPHNVTIDQISPTTTKGDLMVDTGSMITRLAAGFNNQILSSNDNTTEGLEWINNTASLVSYNASGDGNWTEFSPDGSTPEFAEQALNYISSYITSRLLEFGTFTPVFIPVSGTSSISAAEVTYLKIGDGYAVSMRIEVAATSGSFRFDIAGSSLPGGSLSTTAGVGGAGAGAIINARVSSQTGNARVWGSANQINTYLFCIVFLYR